MPRLTLVTASAVLALTLTGCQPATEPAQPAPPVETTVDATPAPVSDSPMSLAQTAPVSSSPTSSPTQAAPVSSSTALTALEAIPVKGRAPRTGYDRDRFGPAWADTDHNGCDQRNDILDRDMTDVVFEAGTKDCVVTSGVLNDTYTGTMIEFVKGGDALVDIDHVVALGNAWETGAQNIGEEDRRQLANDPLNLLSVDGPANRQKGDSDAATWLPSNTGVRCHYVALQTAVKHKYGLWMTTGEHDAITRVLASCPDQPLPTTGGIPGTLESVEQAPTNGSPEPTLDPTPDTASGSGTGPAPAPTPAVPADGVVYASCAEVKAAGAAPIRVGEPGFSTAFDGDGDGVACES
jgi:hypothetical protein